MLDLPIVQRVVIQVQELDYHLKRQVGLVDKSRVLDIEYSKMCSCPSEVIESVVKFIEQHAGKLAISPSQIPKTFISRDKPEYLNKRFGGELLNQMSKTMG